MSRSTSLATPIVALATAVAAGIASAVGVLLRGDASVATVTSVRGETYEMATTGVYAFNAQRVVAEGVGWDLFTLFVAVPAMAIAALLVAHGSFQGRLLAAGLFGYFLYLYLEYAVTWAFGPLFLLFVGTFALALAGLGLCVRDLAGEGIAGRFGAGYPTRALPAVLVTMSLLLAMLWLRRVAEGLTAGVDGLLLGETTMTVQALDLALMVPISAAVALGAWRGTDLGLLAGAAFSVTFTAMTAAITSMLVSAWAVEGEPEAAPLAIFGLATAAGVWLGVRAFRSVHAEARAPRTVLAPAATA
jgi:hypothetical protein